MVALIDLGQPAVVAGTCPKCNLGDRPLWLLQEAGAVACATCCVRAHPGETVRFHDARGPLVVSQPVLL